MRGHASSSAAGAPAALRVGWCPGALRPMMSRDGLIVRVKPRGMALRVDRASGIAAAALRHGNGLIDLTARANLQIRGVTEASLPPLTVELDALGLLDADVGAEARRNVVASPLMGLDPSSAFDVRPTVAALEAALAGAAGLDALPSKFGFAVSDGGATALDGVSADVRFEALPGGRFAVRLDGQGGAEASCAAGAVAEVALRLARAFVEASASDGALHRMRDLVASAGAGAVLGGAGVDGPDPAASLSPRFPGHGETAPATRPRRVGRLAVADTLGVAAPFGRLDAARLDALARAAARAGAVELRLTPWRAVLVPGVDPATLDGLAAECAAAGWIVDPSDPRLRVAACAGAPGCGRGTTPVLDDAAGLAGLLGPGGGGIALHVSGCAKGCAHPAAAPLTLVASGGRYALVAAGTASDAPVAAGLDAAKARRLLETLLHLDRRP